MKLLKILTIACLAGLLAVACSEKSPTTTGQVEQTEEQQPSQMAETAPAEPTELDGMLTQTEKGLAIVTDTDTYIVTGEDLSHMVGQKVKVTGTLAESEEGQVFQVMSVSPME